MQSVTPENNRQSEFLPLSSGIQVWRHQLALNILRIIAVLGTVMLVVSSLKAFTEGYPSWMLLYLFLYGFALLLVFVHQIPYVIKVGSLLSLFYVLGVVLLIEAGLSGDARLFLLVFPCLTTVFWGWRPGLVSLGLTMLTMIGFAIVFSNGWLIIPLESQANTAKAAAWTSGSIVFFALGLTLVGAMGYLFPRLEQSLTRGHKLSMRLQTQQSDLEKLVEERTGALRQRTRYLEVTTEVAREVASEFDMQALLDRIVLLVSERFGLYHVGIFLIDSSGAGGATWAELKAASSYIGRRMVSRGHRIAVGAPGTVGAVLAQGKPSIALDTDIEAAFHNSHGLVETRSILTLPLHLHGNIIGALDMQSQQANAFDSSDAEALQGLTDLVAVAINNAHLFQQLQTAAAAERRAYGELSREAWLKLLMDEQSIGVLSDGATGVGLADVWRPEMRVALRTGKLTPGHEDLLQAETLAIPITVSGQVIGVIDGRKPEGERGWTTEDITLFQALAQQLQVALEGARLYRDSQRRAAREQLTSAVTARMRETLNIETVLQTAAREIGQALGLAALDVRLGGDVEHPVEDKA